MLGGRATDITYSDPKIINRIAADFRRPTSRLLHGAGRGCRSLSAVLLPENIYCARTCISFNCSGAVISIMAANNFMQDRFPVRHGLPADAHRTGCEPFPRFCLEVPPKLLHKNATKLLNIELPEEA